MPHLPNKSADAQVTSLLGIKPISMSHTLGYKVPIYIHSDLHAVMSKLLNVGHADAIDQEQAS